MPKMKWGDAEPDWDELDDAEYEEGDFDRYEGPVPPNNTVLSGVIKKIWGAESQAGNSMFKVLFEAEGNSGDKKKFNGCPIWDNVVWTPQTKFRWQPWLDAVGLTLKDVRQKTITAEDDDNVGKPIMRIGKIKFTEGVDVRVVTKRESYNGEPQARIQEWLAPKDADTDEDDDEDDDGDEDDAPF
jgi:hypothetical protein